MYDLSGKIAIVTGAAGRRGIGRAIATRLASEGANVAVADVSPAIGTIRTEDRAVGWGGLKSVVSEIEETGRESLALFADISDSAQVDDMVGQTLAKFGRIDILVNNAAFRPGRSRVPIVDLEEEAFDEVMRVNVRGTYLVSRAVAAGASPPPPAVHAASPGSCWCWPRAPGAGSAATGPGRR